MGHEVEGLMSEVVDDQGFYVFVPYTDTAYLQKHDITSVGVLIDDGRRISNDQRRKIFALIGDITEWVTAPNGAQRTRAEKETLREMRLLYIIDKLTYDKTEDKEIVRRQLTMHYCTMLDFAPFSLSDVDMTTARDFIDWLVELCVIHGIPCIDTLLNRCEDIERYLYACVINRRCAICGRPADIHEWDHVGLARNRKTIHHEGQRVQPLCRLCHSECHTIGQKSFDEKNHIIWIKLDANACEILKWKK